MDDADAVDAEVHRGDRVLHHKTETGVESTLPRSWIVTSGNSRRMVARASSTSLPTSSGQLGITSGAGIRLHLHIRTSDFKPWEHFLVLG